MRSLSQAVDFDYKVAGIIAVLFCASLNAFYYLFRAVLFVLWAQYILGPEEVPSKAASIVIWCIFLLVAGVSWVAGTLAYFKWRRSHDDGLVLEGIILGAYSALLIGFGNYAWYTAQSYLEYWSGSSVYRGSGVYTVYLKFDDMLIMLFLLGAPAVIISALVGAYLQRRGK